ncbi:MAG: hypothetical protein COA33_013175 [Fluviicola sp.]|nr:hypothetical protein [Fluviicola sp.]
MNKKLRNIDEFIKNSLKTILNENGLIYTEQKFCNIFKTYEKLAETNVFNGELNIHSRKEYYECFFPNLAPKFKNTRKIYESALIEKESFEFHPSEEIYRGWVKEFSRTPLSQRDCKNLLLTYKSWMNWHNEIESIQFRNIKEKIVDDIKSKKIDFNNYKSADREVEYYLSKCFKVQKEVKISGRNLSNENRIYVLGLTESSAVKIEEHTVVKVNSLELNYWLAKLGINLSLTTCQYLLEYGFPYCGYLIEPQNLFCFSGNTKSIIGLLAYNLNDRKAGRNEDLLNESAVLALSRLEYYINPEKLIK